MWPTPRIDRVSHERRAPQGPRTSRGDRQQNGTPQVTIRFPILRSRDGMVGRMGPEKFSSFWPAVLVGSSVVVQSAVDDPSPAKAPSPTAG